jgi:hypothetical protein
MPSPARVGRRLGSALPAAFSVGMFLSLAAASRSARAIRTRPALMKEQVGSAPGRRPLAFKPRWDVLASIWPWVTARLSPGGSITGPAGWTLIRRDSNIGGAALSQVLYFMVATRSSSRPSRSLPACSVTYRPGTGWARWAGPAADPDRHRRLRARGCDDTPAAGPQRRSPRGSLGGSGLQQEYGLYRPGLSDRYGSRGACTGRRVRAPKANFATTIRFARTAALVSSRAWRDLDPAPEVRMSAEIGISELQK